MTGGGSAVGLEGRTLHVQYLCWQPQGSSVGQHFPSVLVQETDSSHGLNLSNMHVHMLGSKLLHWQLCPSGSRIAITEEAQNSTSVFMVVIILRFVRNQESFSPRYVQ